MLSYEGIFFDPKVTEFIKSLEPTSLSKVNNSLHCTFKYHPEKDEIFNDIVGKEFDLYLIGYGNDGQNSGFKVELSPELKKYYINYDEQNTNVLKTPHITVSLSEGAIPVNTKNLNFIPLEEKIQITGRFGYWIKDRKQSYISYEPYNK